MVPICLERWYTEANEATQTHCHNSVAPAYPVWAYYVHGQQRRCQEDPVSLLSGRVEKTTRSSSRHVAQHRPTGSPLCAPRSSRFGSELPSVEDDVDVWRYAILELHARNDDEHDLMYLLYCVRSMILMPAWSTCRHRRSKRSSSPTAWTCLPRGNDSANTIHGTLPDTEYS